MDQNLKHYDKQFYDYHLAWQDDYLAVSKWINENLKGKIYGDIGCGNGYLIRNLLKNNRKKVWGVDGSKKFMDYIDKAILPFVERVDLTNRSNLPKADVAICLEVAEHIEYKYSDVLVENIVSTGAKTIMFTAAPPGQGGVAHVNEQPHSFWIKKLRRKGYILDKSLSDKFRTDLGDELRDVRWYLNNMMIFYKVALVEKSYTLFEKLFQGIKLAKIDHETK